MKRIVLIIMFISVSIWAKEGDMEISINGGISSGSGFGLTYNITENARIKIASAYIGLFWENENISMYSIGGSFSFDLKKLSDNKSSVYFFLGTNHLGMNFELPIHLYGLGLGLRKFIDKKMFFEVELGYAYYNLNSPDEISEDINITFITGSLNLGYQF